MTANSVSNSTLIERIENVGKTKVYEYYTNGVMLVIENGVSKELPMTEKHFNMLNKRKERNSEKNLLKSMEQVEENCKKAWSQPDCQRIGE